MIIFHYNIIEVLLPGLCSSQQPQRVLRSKDSDTKQLAGYDPSFDFMWLHLELSGAQSGAGSEPTVIDEGRIQL